AAGKRVEQLADDLVCGSVARLGRLTLRAMVVPDGVRFVQVSEHEAVGLFAERLQQLRPNGGVRRIAVSIQGGSRRDGTVWRPSCIGRSGAKQPAVVGND